MLRKLQARGFVRGPEEFYISEKVLAGLKSLRENWALQIQPRRGDLKAAQDGVLGVVFGEISSPEGRLNSFSPVSAVPPGLADGCDLFPGLASWATFKSPLRGWICKAQLSRRL